jgi:endonuclease/exonuclease/phosphatase family metal-dependent hydrolase
MDPVSRLVVAALLLAAGCGADLGQPGEWVALDQLEGPLAWDRGDAPTSMAAAPSVVRLVTYNVRSGADVDGLAAAISGDPDLRTASVITLQEEEDHPGEGGSRAGRLAVKLGMSWVYVPARAAGDGSHGLAILSHLPIEAVDVMSLPLSEVSQPRIAVRAQLATPAGSLTVIDVHLGAVLNATDRILQLRPAVIDETGPLVVAGDFNTSAYAWSQDVPDVPAGVSGVTDQAPIIDDYMAALGFAAPTAGLGPTEDTLGYQSRLDSIYTLGQDAQPGAVVRTIDLSDHWPMWIDLDPAQ